MRVGRGCLSAYWRSVRCCVALTAIVALISGCTNTSSTTAQVIDRGHDQSRAQVVQRYPVTAGQYIVQPGDTLYSIAFRFGWDWKQLASHNNLADPSKIRVGQVIRFDNKPVAAVAASKAATQASPSTPKNSAPVAVRANTTPVVAAKPVPVVAENKPATTAVARSAKGWVWPTQGSVISRYSSNSSLNKGIDIAGSLGQSVLAASDGTVVYAGSGLRGYGELIIIKHNETYVSAYGHNRRLLVREGQQVKAGERIAEMGSTGADRVKLHFEIRRQGKPVDPLQYLPKR